jgi:hypothetical protein
MSKHTIDDLREHLFAALDGLRDKDAPMDIERAKALADVAQTIINSAKVEVDHMRVTGGSGSGFLAQPDAGPRTGFLGPVDTGARVTRTPTGIKTVDGAITRHVLK